MIMDSNITSFFQIVNDQLSGIGEQDPPTFYSSLSKYPKGGKLQLSRACGTNMHLPVPHTNYVLAAFVSVQYQLSHIRWGVSDFGCGQANAFNKR